MINEKNNLPYESLGELDSRLVSKSSDGWEVYRVAYKVFNQVVWYVYDFNQTCKAECKTLKKAMLWM